ncbi:cytochrome c [Tropicimonas sp. IMCC6043]|uniref:cytochrome c n=1 Tax=Tropicimonas sp. IMCC6043 TaxID=2510645 RepID=UPI00101E1659|nr:cytochrome c [Tropicimonas sp. IMCC6043]RYH10396.1 c-type cytochrome [Tropicimonas sp. IMCC6043]
MGAREIPAMLCLLVLAACAPTVPGTGTDTGPALAAEVSRANGRDLFWAGGCASCHAGEGRLSTAAPRLGGGRPIVTGHGIVHATNISSDPVAGIGAWSLEDFDRAMRQGLAPDGRAYLPAFPYPSYARMSEADIADLYAYLSTLPGVPDANIADRLPFPVNLPGAAEAWRGLYLRPGPVVDLPGADAEVARGQYLVEGPGHCGACHTARTPLGGPRLGQWLAGAEVPDGSGFAANLTPHEEGLAGWSAEEIVDALRPTRGSYEGMEAARYDLAQLPESDLYAIAAYLQALPARPIPESELE